MAVTPKLAPVGFALAVALSMNGCTTSTRHVNVSSPSSSVSHPADAFALLKARPLTLSAVGAHACTNTRTKSVAQAFGPALQPISGPAIVMPVGFSPDGRLDWVFNRPAGWTTWGGQKVLWIVSPTYRGPVLIRGHQLAGRNEVRFQDGLHPSDSLKLVAEGASTSGQWRDFPSYTRVRASGCYAYQVDGEGFTEVIAFRAVRDPAADVK